MKVTLAVVLGLLCTQAILGANLRVQVSNGEDGVVEDTVMTTEELNDIVLTPAGIEHPDGDVVEFKNLVVRADGLFKDVALDGEEFDGVLGSDDSGDPEVEFGPHEDLAAVEAQQEKDIGNEQPFDSNLDEYKGMTEMRIENPGSEGDLKLTIKKTGGQPELERTFKKMSIKRHGSGAVEVTIDKTDDLPCFKVNVNLREKQAIISECESIDGGVDRDGSDTDSLLGANELPRQSRDTGSLQPPREPTPFDLDDNDDLEPRRDGSDEE